MTEDNSTQTINNQSNGTNPKPFDEKNAKASEALLRLIDDSEFEFFHDEQDESYCRFKSIHTKVYETRRIKEKNFKSYLCLIYRKKFEKTINDISLKEVLQELQGRALYDGKKEKVFLRVGEVKGNIYIDLCDDQWRAIEITPTDWAILNSKDVPIRFERYHHMRPLPEPLPAREGKISLLWGLVNIPKKDRCLVLTFILNCFRCNTIYAMLVLLGHQGCGKSTTQEFLRNLIDPSICPLRTPPRKPDDLVVEAKRNRLVSYNNVSGLSNEMHDDLCSICTGGGFSTRKLFTDNDQIICDIRRPVMCNGITNFIRRPDLLDRAVVIQLPQMEKRISDERLKIEANESFPSIFGGLLDLMVKVLGILPTVKLPPNSLRMIDYARLGVAIEKAMKFPKNTFLKQYKNNRKEAEENVIESSPVIQALINFIDTQPGKTWRGRPLDLLKMLTEREKPTIRTSWPETAAAMSSALTRFEIPLKQKDIQVFKEPRGNDGQYYRISKTPTLPTQPTPAKKKTSKDVVSKGYLDRVGQQENDTYTEETHLHSLPCNLHPQKNSMNPDGTYVCVGSGVSCVGSVGENLKPNKESQEQEDDFILIN